jgi:hypothetical protein
MAYLRHGARWRNSSPDLVIIIRPHDRRGTYEALFDGRRLCVSRQPFLDAARILQGAGISSDTRLIARRGASGPDTLRSTIGAAARLTVEESRYGCPSFRHYRKHPRGAVASPPIRQFVSAAGSARVPA